MGPTLVGGGTFPPGAGLKAPSPEKIAEAQAAGAKVLEFKR